MLDAMFENLKQTMLMGVGLAAMTKDKAEQWAREMAEQAKLSKEKGQEFINEVSHRAEKARDEMRSNVQKLVDDSLKQTSIATREQIVALEARIAKLEELLAQR